MQYYKAKKDVNIIHHKTRKMIDAVIKDELFTEKELLKTFNLKPEHKNRPLAELWPRIKQWFDIVNIKKTETYRLFDARFEAE